MNLTMDREDVMFAITIYLAIKGMKTKSGDFEFNWNKNIGLRNIIAKDIVPINGEIDANKLLELVKKH